MDPTLQMILEHGRKPTDQGFELQVGERVIRWHSQFRLTLTTKERQIKLHPELWAKVSVLDFAPTPKALEEQMLALIISKESPDVERRKFELSSLAAQMLLELADTEDSVLQMLSSCEGSILKDQVLIDALAASKDTSQAIASKVAEVEQTEEEIDYSRKAYIPLAQRAVLLFLAVQALSHLDPFYQFSLQWFKDIFSAALGEASKQSHIQGHLQSLSKYFTQRVFHSVTQALFNATDCCSPSIFALECLR